eukprot:363801_1
MFQGGKDIIIDNMCDITRNFFIDGYKLERARMLDMDKICAHHQFQSVSKFFDHLQILFNTLEEKMDSTSEDIIHEKIHSLIGVGCCKQCSLYIITNIDGLCRVKFSVKIGKNTLTKQYEDDVSRACNYFSCCLQYPQTTNYMFNHSGVYRTFFLYQHLLVVFTNGKCKLEMEKRSRLKNKLDLQVTNIETNICYRGLATILLQLIRNIKFLKEYHWEGIVKCSQYFCEWLYFVQKQLEYGLFVSYPFGTECMYCFFVLIAIGLYYISEKQWISIMEIKRMSILNWFENLKNIGNKIACNNFNLHVFKTICAFIALEKVNNLKLLYDKYVSFGKEVWNLKRNDVQCQYQLCTVRRKDILDGKLFKCKGCRTARYCSKHCQKCDWKNHKKYCSKLCKTRKRDRKNLKKQKRHFKEEQSVIKWRSPLNEYTLKYLFGI